MRFEVRNLREFKHAARLMDGGCRISFQTTEGVVAVRVNENDVWVHEIAEDIVGKKSGGKKKC